MKKKENWFVLQIFGGKEQRVALSLKKLALNNVRPYLPLKKLKIRKSGKTYDKLIPLYPGYMFMIGQWDITDAKKIITVQDIIKFVGGFQNPGILHDNEVEIIRKITSDGAANYSKVIREGTKIRIISGPLKELEGNIITVDRRKQRAMVELPLLNSTIKVSLGFEYLVED